MMGKAMTEMGEGERAERAKRMRFWKRIGGLAAVGGLVGFVLGFLHGRDAANQGRSFGEALSTIPPSVGIIFVLFMLISFAVITWIFVKSIDEVELADNLWGSTAGFYLYALVFPTWWALARLGVATEPNDWAIFLISFAGGTAVYAWRKWVAR